MDYSLTLTDAVNTTESKRVSQKKRSEKAKGIKRPVCNCAYVLLSPTELGLTKKPKNKLLHRFVSFSPGLRGRAVCTSIIESPAVGIASQIAVRLASEAVIEEAIRTEAELNDPVFGVQAPDLVRAAFREANQRVFEYAKKMSGSEGLIASGLIGIYDGERFSLGQVGRYESFLYRNKCAYRLCEAPGFAERKEPQDAAWFIGGNAKVLVDLASVPLEPGDLVVLSTFPPHDTLLALAEMVFAAGHTLSESCEAFAAEGLAYEQKNLSPVGALPWFPGYEGEQEVRERIVFCLKRGD